jgi:uncharacterized lipoprotein
MLNRQALRASLISCPLLLAAGCSWFGDKPPEYVEAREVPRLAVPEDLDAPRYFTPLLISAPEMRMPSGDELNPGPPRVASTGGRADASSFIAWSAQGVYLHVDDSPDSVQRRLGFAISRSGMELMDEGAGEGHRFEYTHLVRDTRSFWQKLAFWNNDLGPNYSGFYRTRVEPDADGSRVYLLFDSGEPATTGAAEHILAIFMERLG